MDLGVEAIYLTYDWCYRLQMFIDVKTNKYIVEYKKNGGKWEYITWLEKNVKSSSNKSSC